DPTGSVNSSCGGWTVIRVDSLYRQRTGFTLVELLIVIGIIVVLAALTLSATMQVIGTQYKNNSEQTVKKVALGVQKQWDIVVSTAKNERIPPGVISLAGGDERRARVLWIKLRLKQEFPMTYTEALQPWGPATAPAYLSAADLPSLYAREIGA